MSEVPEAQRARHLRPRLKGVEDDYGVVLASIITALIVMGLVGELAGGRAVTVVMFLVIFFLTMQTSGVSRRTVSRLAVAIPLVIAVGAATEVLRPSAYLDSLSLSISALLVIASLVTIARRLLQHSVVTQRTIFGSLCIYLFGGLLFALVYNVVGLLSEGPFFAQTNSASIIDYIYFSFITMATVGFGDLSPAASLGRMIAVVEGISGQLYLVVVVALFVGNLARRHSDRGDTDKENVADPN